MRTNPSQLHLFLDTVSDFKVFYCPITISLQMSEFPPISWGQSHDKLLPTYTEFHFVLIHCLLQGPSKITVYGLYILVVPREK